MAFRENSSEKPVEASPVAHKYIPRFFKRVTELPSGGKAYPERLEVKYRPYTFGEVKTLNQTGQTQISPRDRILAILEGVECSDGFDPLDLTLQDVFFLGFLRKRATFGKQDTIHIASYCSACRKRTNLVMRENEHLEFNDLQAPSLPIRFEMHSEEFSFSPLTVRSFIKHGLDQLLNSETENLSIAVLAAQCTSHDYETAYEAISSASPEEGELLDQADEFMVHDLKPVTLYCGNKREDATCGHKIEVRLDEVDLLVLPFRGEPEKPNATGLHFGKKPGNQPSRGVRSRVSGSSSV